MFPEQSQKLVDGFQAMQESIYSLTQDRFQDVYELIENSHYFDTESKVYEVIKEVFYIAMITIDHYDVLAKFVSYIDEKLTYSNKFFLIRDICIELATKPVYDDQFSWYKKSSDFKFLRALFSEGLYSVQEILNAREYFPSRMRNQKFLYSIYFLPELHDILPETIIGQNDFEYVDNSLKEIVHCMKHYSCNNFEKLHEYFKYGYSVNSIEYLIKYDNWEKFYKWGPLNFDPTNKLPINPFETHPELQGRNYIDLTAFYGAIKCFKSFLMLGCDWNLAASFAAAGGCIEIYRILNSMHCSNENVLPYSVIYRQNKIFDWIMEFNNEWDFEKRYKESYRNSIETNNMHALSYFINDNYDVNFTDIISESTLHTAARNGNSTVFQIISGFNGADVNGLDISGNTPLRIAVDNGQHHFVEDMNDLGIEPNCHGSLRYTPLHLAVQQDNLHLVEALLKCKGINVNFENKFGMTPLSMAKSESIRKVLISAGAI